MASSSYVHFEQKARYLTCGTLSKSTKYVWLCCHGYGQLATYFKRKFDHFGDEHFVIVPEGQHRFYLKGTDGRVGASWMSKEDREVDIENYLSYLNVVVSDALSTEKNADYTFVAMGFSQGTATVGRWVAQTTRQVDEFVLWAGQFPQDVDPGIQKSRFNQMNIHLLHGDADPYINEERSHLLVALLEAADLTYTKIVFQGVHEIPRPTLDALVRRIEEARR